MNNLSNGSTVYVISYTLYSELDINRPSSKKVYVREEVVSSLGTMSFVARGYRFNRKLVDNGIPSEGTMFHSYRLVVKDIDRLAEEVLRVQGLVNSSREKLIEKLSDASKYLTRVDTPEVKNLY